MPRAPEAASRIYASAVNRLLSVLASPSAPISGAMAQLDRAGTGVLVLVNENRKLHGVVTDGDIRRAILAGISLEEHCGTIATRQPVVALPSVTPAEALHLMDRGREQNVHHLPNVNSLPVVDAGGVVVGLVLRSDIVSEDHLALSAVIMAGGYGTRLLPLTERIPKPMLPVGDRPLLERTIGRLREAGIRRVAITTHHLADRIERHFGDGRDFGVQVEYVSEDRPLGTAGALRLLKDVDDPLLVINGDILTGLRFRNMLDYHRQEHADATVGVRVCELEIPYGVLECEGLRVHAVREKPQLHFLINAGVYLLQPSTRRYIPEGRRFDMTDFIERLLHEGCRVVSFPIVEYWLDIGAPADYEQAQKDLCRAEATTASASEGAE